MKILGARTRQAGNGTPSDVGSAQAATGPALFLTGTVGRVIAGAFAVVLGGVGGGFLGGFVGHVLSGGDKNVGLNVALIGIILGAVAALGLLAGFARTSRDWRMFAGGVLGIVLGGGLLAWLLWLRAPS